MVVEVLHLRHEIFGMSELGDCGIDSRFVVSRSEDLGGDAPHVRHFLVEAEDLPVHIDHQDAIGGRLERSAQKGESSARLVLCLATLCDVFNERDQV